MKNCCSFFSDNKQSGLLINEEQRPLVSLPSNALSTNQDDVFTPIRSKLSPLLPVLGYTDLVAPEVLSSEFFKEISNRLRDEQIGSDVKLCAGAVGWQLASLVFTELVPDYQEVAWKFVLFSLATGAGAMLALNAGMFGAQAVLHRAFGSAAASTLYVSMVQLIGSTIIADGAWQAAYNTAHGLWADGAPSIHVLPYLFEALLFTFLQYIIHMLTPSQYKENSFQPTAWFTFILFTAYVGFDYISTALEQLCKIPSNNYATLATSAIGTVIPPALCYGLAFVVLNSLHSEFERLSNNFCDDAPSNYNYGAT